MYRRFLVFSAAALCLTAASRAQAPVTIALFRGDAGDESNIRLGAWGSGRAEADTQRALIGNAAIRITTNGLYQGARLDFKNPIDLAPAFANPKTYVRFQVRFAGTGASQEFFDPSSTQTTRAAASPFERMRFLLTMVDGSRYELVRPIELPPSEDPDQWVPIAFPVAALRKKPIAAAPAAAATTATTAPTAPAPDGAAAPAPTGEAAKLAQMAIFGDKYQQFYVGEINVITDDTEISIAPLDEQIAFARTTLSFAGSAEGGATTLKYSWDFDAKDGIQEDATGRTVSKSYSRAGKYTVTLTVSDVDGLKPPATTRVELDVAE